MWVGIAVTIALLLMPSAACAQAEKRFALLIGNQGYSTKIGALKNPHADIALIGEALRSLGSGSPKKRMRVTKQSTLPSSVTSKPFAVKAKAPSASSTIPATVLPIPTPRSTI